MKELSVALILETPAGYLFCHPTSRHFIPGSWDLPKGHMELGEQPYDTMVRELREETGIDFNTEILSEVIEFKDFGVQPYNKQKNLWVFYAKIGFIPPEATLICTSTFTDSYGNEVPEHNGFTYSWDLSLPFPNLRKVIESVLKKDE
jgi:8-oxo-dGTP pyrophosphatase MutT (NUDIX family)